MSVLIKSPLVTDKELNIRVFESLQHIVIFAHKNNYTVTAINIKTKLNGIIQAIKNDKRHSDNSQGFKLTAAERFLNSD